MQFYLHREGVQFTSRGNFNGIGMGKHPTMTAFFSYPGFIFTTVYRRFFNQFDCFKKGVG